MNYNLPDHWYLVSGPVMTANWAAKTGDIWTVPLGGGVGKLFRLGQILPLRATRLRISRSPLEIRPYGLVARPDVDGAKWQLRFQLSFCFRTRSSRKSVEGRVTNAEGGGRVTPTGRCFPAVTIHDA